MVNNTQVRHLRGKSAGELLALLALWHATNGCKRSATYDVFIRIYGKTVHWALKFPKSEAAREETRERIKLFRKELLSQAAVREAYETLLEEGFISHAQAG